jgi:hypothetical protein
MENHHETRTVVRRSRTAKVDRGETPMKDERGPSEAGQALVVLTVAMVGLLVVVGLALDGGTAYLERRRMQNAADAGSREGARQLYIWQVRAAYPDDSSGEQALLSAVHAAAEANGVHDTDGAPGNAVNDNIIAYYVDSEGVPLSNTLIGESGSLNECLNNRCRPEGSGRCCGVQAEVNTEFDTGLISLTGPISAPVEAAAAGVFVMSDGFGGLGNSALFALGTGCGPDQMTLRGDRLRVIGTVHSNDGVRIPNDRPHIDRLAYVDAGDVIISGNNPQIDVEEDLDFPVDPNLPFTTTYYARYSLLNGTYHSGDWAISSNQTGVHHIDGDFTVSGDDIDMSGLYYVKGNVLIGGDRNTLLGTTIVATGTIRITTDRMPYSPWNHPASHSWGIVLYSDHDAVDKCSDSGDVGIYVKGDNPNREGVFYAPRSRIVLDAQAGAFTGAFIGWSVSVDGNAWSIEAWRPAGGAVGFLERITLVR